MATRRTQVLETFPQLVAAGVSSGRGLRAQLATVQLSSEVVQGSCLCPKGTETAPGRVPFPLCLQGEVAADPSVRALWCWGNSPSSGNQGTI